MVRAAVNKGEQMLWHQQYLRSCEELNQWDPLQEYARSTEHYGLLMDCLWRAQDWGTLKQEVMPKAHVRPRRACPVSSALLQLLAGPLHSCLCLTKHRNFHCHAV